MDTKPRKELLALAEACGAFLTGKPDGSEAVTVIFTPEAWRKFDTALVISKMKKETSKATPATARPNYRTRCLACGAKPTVDMVTEDKTHHLNLCGPCTFGDPSKWND